MISKAALKQSLSVSISTKAFLSTNTCVPITALANLLTIKTIGFYSVKDQGGETKTITSQESSSTMTNASKKLRKVNKLDKTMSFMPSPIVSDNRAISIRLNPGSSSSKIPTIVPVSANQLSSLGTTQSKMANPSTHVLARSRMKSKTHSLDSL